MALGLESALKSTTSTETCNMGRLFINRPCQIPNTNRNTMIYILFGYVDVEMDYYSVISIQFLLVRKLTVLRDSARRHKYLTFKEPIHLIPVKPRSY